MLSIGDGDTIRVRMNGKPISVRLACIDAPETVQRPYGQNARQYLQQRLPVGSAVRLDEKTTDRYGRLVAEVFSRININLAMVEDGQAFAYRQYLGDCNAREYLDAEYRASRRRYGVWQVEGGITRPWEFRKSLRAAVIPDGTTPDGRRYSCKEIGSYVRAQELLRQGTPISTATETGRPANRCGAELLMQRVIHEQQLPHWVIMGKAGSSPQRPRVVALLCSDILLMLQTTSTNKPCSPDLTCSPR